MKEQLARAAGLTDEFFELMSDEVLLQNLASIHDQLDQFINCMEKEFEPLRQELDTYLSHGQINFELLPLIVTKGMKLVFVDEETDDMLAVRVEEVRIDYDSDNGDFTQVEPVSFVVSASHYSWQGEGYTRIYKTRSIMFFNGTMPISDVPWKVLSPEVEKELTERGRIYCQYSGVFHVYNNGPIGGKGRAIVDIEKLPNGTAAELMDPYSFMPPQQPRRVRNSDWGGYSGAPPPDVQMKLEVKKILSNDELCLLPPTVTGFMLKDKRWVSMRVTALSPVKFDERIWDHLVLDA
ncbi:hypothetical protein M422DRAFT_72734, partial [Sphaerobolus stellatus SS14]